MSNDSRKAFVVIQYPLDREFQSVYQMELVVIDHGGVSGLLSHLILDQHGTKSIICVI